MAVEASCIGSCVFFDRYFNTFWDPCTLDNFYCIIKFVKDSRATSLNTGHVYGRWHRVDSERLDEVHEG